jgi:2-aminoadipate transaminase
MSRHGGVIHIGSFSKSIAPALRVGYIVAGEDMIARMLALKIDAGSGALEQMVLAEYCTDHFASHVPRLTRGLRAKLEILMESLAEQFGTTAEFDDPAGGIFLWIKLPDQIDVRKLVQPAAAAGIVFNPGPEWACRPEAATSHMRLCFALPSKEDIRAGVAALARVCFEETGIPAQSANVRRAASPSR